MGGGAGCKQMARNQLHLAGVGRCMVLETGLLHQKSLRAFSTRTSISAAFPVATQVRMELNLQRKRLGSWWGAGASDSGDSRV